MRIKKRYLAIGLGVAMGLASYFPSKTVQGSSNSNNVHFETSIDSSKHDLDALVSEKNFVLDGNLLHGLRGDSIRTKSGLSFKVDSADAAYNNIVIPQLEPDSLLDLRKNYGFKNVAKLMDVTIGVGVDSTTAKKQVKEWKHLFEKHAKTYNKKFKVNGSLAFYVTMPLCEGFNTKGISYTGCMGLGSQNTDFLKGDSRDKGIAKEGMNPLNKDQAIEATVRYSAYLLLKSGGNERMAALRYNRGSGRVNTAIKKVKSQGLVVTVNNILSVTKDQKVWNEGRAYDRKFQQKKHTALRYLNN